MNITVRELVRVFGGDLILGDPRTVAKRAVVDSRLVEKGDIFFALKGEKTDGHLFAMSTASAGAAAVVVSHLNWFRNRKGFGSAVIVVEDPMVSLRLLAQHIRSNFECVVVGITGSNGKTTTKQMVASVMKPLGPGLATKGNLNSQVGLPLMMSEISKEDRWLVLEMGASEPGHISSLAELAKPKIGVITSIGPAHLQSFGSLQKIADAKWELMDTLPFNGTAVVPWGEPLLEPHIRTYTKPLVFYGEDSSCPVRASNIEVTATVRFQLHLNNDHAPVVLPIGGRFNVRNALAAASVGWVLGRSLDEIAKSLNSFEPPKMRMETFSHSSGALLINDAYNANPASMMESIRSMVESYPEKKKFVVIGSMLELGSDSERMHFHLGAEMAKLPLEKAYLFGEEMASAKEGATAAGLPPNKFEQHNSIEAIASDLSPRLANDVVVLIKGSRGMKMESVLAFLQGDTAPSGRI